MKKAVAKKKVDAFFYDVPREYPQNASAMKPARGKTGKKTAFSQCGGDETTTYYDRAFLKKIIFEFQIAEMQLSLQK